MPDLRMKINCPGCGQQLPINDDLLGAKIRCGGCNALVDVPAAKPVASRQIEVPNEAGKSMRPAGDTSAMLIDCTCGTRVRMPSSSQSGMRCPNCQRLISTPNQTASKVADSVPENAVPTTPLPLPTFNSESQPVGPSFPVQPNELGNTSFSNRSIIVTAVSCLIGLILVIGTGFLVISLMKVANKPSVESVTEESDPTVELAEFQEGYCMMLPTGFRQISREETGLGYIVYRFRSEEGYRFTLAMIPHESGRRFAKPPQDYSQALVKSVDELSEGIDAEVQAERVTVDGMPATLFRYYERETYRGVTFTYFMVAMDRERKLVLKIAGKYGGYHEQDKNISLPDSWYDSLLTLRHDRNVKKPSESPQP